MPVQKFQFALEQFTNFGDLLKYLRRRAGLTQRELSFTVGYSHAQISRLEQNQRTPDMAMIAARFLPALDLENEPEVAARLVELAGLVSRQEAPGSGIAPFKGLQFFDETDADLFFGREAMTEQIIERMRLPLSNSRELRFLAVIGASGSGKTSLVRAGLIPVLRRTPPFNHWMIRCITPTARPLQALSGCLVSNEMDVQATAALIDSLGSEHRSLHLAATLLLEKEKPSRSARRERSPNLLLIVDQFEELYTLCQDETERQAFIDNLTTAATEPGGSVFVITVLRADFYARCAPYPALRDALASRQMYIGPMNAENLRRAILEPARRCDWELEPGLVELLLNDLGVEDNHDPEPGSLPLLSHALLETWRRRSGRTLTVSGYLASGGVRGAIAETANDVYYDELDVPQREIARNIFLRLIQIGEEDGSAETRRRATLTELVRQPGDEAIVQEVLNRLVNARLVITDHGSAELAHEALIRAWPTLRSWLDADREGLLLHRHLTLAAEEWERRKRDPGELYRGGRLAQVQAWVTDHPNELSPSERDYLAASDNLARQEEAERDTQRRHELEIAQALAETQRQAATQLRRRAVFLTVAVFLALIMAGAALYLGEMARRSAVAAQNQRRIAYGRELAAAALNSLDFDPERGILLALQAVSTTRDVDGSVLPEAEEALHRSILASQVRLTLSGLNQWVISTAFSPDGSRLAGIGRDGTTIMWDSVTGQELLRLPGTTPPGDAIGMQRLAFSPDGKRLATGDSNLVKIWDMPSGALLMTLSGHAGEVWAVAYSPDGRLIASGAADGSVRIWDAESGSVDQVLAGHSASVENLAFRPDGKQLATAGDDQALKIWDVSTGRLLDERADFASLVDSVAYSPDGKMLAATTSEGLMLWEADAINERATLSILESVGGVTFSPDGTRLAAFSGSLAKLWDAQTGRELLTLAGHAGWVEDLAFSPDGMRLATASFDETVKVWSLAPGQEEVTLAGKGARVTYSPDGTKLATDGADGTATIWDASTGKIILTLKGHSAMLMGVAFRPDGQRLATASMDKTAKVWDLATGQALFTLTGHEIGVRDVAYSPNGKRIATAGFDQTARLWDGETGRELRKLTGHTGLVLGVAFSPDGQRLATSSTDKTAKIWDVTTGQLLFTLAGHLEPIPDITFSPDGALLATGSQDGTAKIWNSSTGQELQTLTGHVSEIQSVTFSPDGKWLATGSGDNSAKIWEVATGKEQQTLPGSLGGVFGVAFSPADQGKRLAVASTDGIVRVYVLPIDEVIALARARVTRALTQAECQKYLHLPSCPVG